MRHALKAPGAVAAALALVMGVCGSAGSAPRQTQGDDLRSLLMAAIDSPSGEASAELSGEMASAIAARFKAESPLRVHVTTLRRYRQSGCSRLNVRLSQEGVWLPQAASPQARSLDIGLNYCRDGNPPASLD